MLQAKEAQAFAAKASGNTDEALAMLMELNRPADVREQFLTTLKRTPSRSKAIYGSCAGNWRHGDGPDVRD